MNKVRVLSFVCVMFMVVAVESLCAMERSRVTVGQVFEATWQAIGRSDAKQVRYLVKALLQSNAKAGNIACWNDLFFKVLFEMGNGSKKEKLVEVFIDLFKGKDGILKGFGQCINVSFKSSFPGVKTVFVFERKGWDETFSSQDVRMVFKDDLLKLKKNIKHLASQ